MNKVDINNLEVCMDLVTRFTHDYLDNDISNLVDYSFWSLLDDYDNAYEQGYIFNSAKKDIFTFRKEFDGDRLNIVYAIDNILYHDKKIPNFKGYLGHLYTGDTINTYNTLFGNKYNFDENGIDFEKKVEIKYEFNDGSSLLDLRNEFYMTFQTIGNFYLLPKEEPGIGSSINSYRGKCNWNDYFDVFLFHLDNCLNEHITDEEVGLQYYLNLPNANMFFKKFNGINSFCKLFMLEDYLSFSFGHPDDTYLSHKTIIESDKYKTFCMRYIKDSSEKIVRRSHKIVYELKSKGL